MEALEVGAYWLLLLTAWEQERHGFLPDEDDKLRRWSRLSREQWAQSRELILSRFPVTEPGWRTNPRMVLEAEKARLFAEKQSANGLKGGRPKKNPNLSIDNPGLTHKEPRPSKKQTQKKLAVAVALSISRKDKDTAEEAAVLENFRSAWNQNCGGLTKILKITGDRAANIRLRLDEGLSIESFETAVRRCAESPFLLGVTNSGFQADFDWLLKEDKNITKVLEGKYGDRATPAKASPIVEPEALYNSPDYKRKAVNQ